MDVRSTKVGNRSTNSERPFMATCEFVRFGTLMINGTLVATSKLLYFANSPCSPSDQPKEILD